MLVQFERDWRRFKKAELNELPKPIANVLIRRRIATLASQSADPVDIGEQDGERASVDIGSEAAIKHRRKRHKP